MVIEVAAARSERRQIASRVDTVAPRRSNDQRLQDERYLGLVRRWFRVWDEADT